VNADEIRQKLRAAPFVPFWIYTSDGKHLDVSHSEMAMVAQPVADPTQDITDRYDSVSPLDIVRLEPLVAA
jgi:hypothetical protein